MPVNYYTRLIKTVTRNKQRVDTQSRQRRGGVTDLYALDYVSEISNGIIRTGTSDNGAYVVDGVTFKGVEEGDISSVEGRIQALTRAIKANVKDATVNGVAGVVGCFGLESNVTARRYEADFATNYQYDKMEQEPTAENLMGSWAGFLGLYGGSGLNQQGYLSNGKHWIGVGLGQWTGPRGEALYNFAKQNNASIFSFSTQVGFMLSEPRLSDIFKSIVTSNQPIDQTTSRFLAEWEGVPGNKLAQRIEYANKFKGLIEETLKEEIDENIPDQPDMSDIKGIWSDVYDKTDAGDTNLKPHARRARHLIMQLFGIAEAGGYRADSDGYGTGHADGLAVDFMIGAYGSADDPQGKGQAIADFLSKNMEPLQISYIIWQQKFFSGQQNKYGAPNQWNPMEDRGDNTQNHKDHVHVSFRADGGNQPKDMEFDYVPKLENGRAPVYDGIEDIIDNTPSKNKGVSLHRVLIPGDLDRFQRWFIKILVSNNSDTDEGTTIPLTDAHMTIKATNDRTGKTMELDVTDILKHEHPCDWIGSQTTSEAVYPTEDPMEGYDIMNLAWYLNSEQRDILYSPGEKLFTIRAYGTAKITLRNFLKFSHIN